MKPQTQQFKRRLPQFLSNPTLRQNVVRATQLSLSKRAKVVGEIPRWEALREQAHRIKREVIDRLPEMLERFEAQARQRGIIVHRAQDAREANAIAEGIAREAGVRTIVKSKSMLTEEIDFNEAMIARGYEVVETDLGEYIIQLAGEPPSHLTGPAIHKSRKEIAALFAEKLGVPYSEDPEVLTEIARKTLRQKFLSAEMGVTGANFGIVETGQIAVVENEGNARLCMTLPRVHVAFIGIERLIPLPEHLPLFLTLLCRSSTGQKLTGFITLVDGPRAPDALDGPEKVHYILVDNGRSRLRADEHLREALYCIRCGACYNVCPVYQNIGGHAYGWVYQGPIGAVITPEFLGLEQAGTLPFASSLCGACSNICPVKIPLHHLLLYQRHRVVEAGMSPRWERLAMRGFHRVNRSPRRVHLVGALARTFRRLMGGKLPVPGWIDSREFPDFPPQTFRQWWKQQGEAAND